MRVTVDAKALQAALVMAGRPVGKSTLPVLEHVLVRTNGTGLEVAGTNLEVWIRCHVSGQIQDAGQVTLPQKRLVDFVGQLGRTQLTIATSGTKATLTAGQGKATITGFDAEEFPVMPEAVGVTVYVKGGDLLGALSRVLSAAAPDDSRPVLAGCLVRMVDTTLEMVTADGFRLARTEVPIASGDLDKPFSVIVPARALREAKAMLPKGDEEVTLRVGMDGEGVPTTFEMQTEQTTFASKLIDGQFPDFNRIVPREFKATATISSDDLERATKGIRAVLGAKDPITRMKLKQGLESGEMREVVVWGQDAETGGESEFTLPAEVDLASPGDGPVVVAFNGKYLVDMLDSLGAKQMTLGANGPAAPGMFREPGVLGLASYVVVMPMHVAR